MRQGGGYAVPVWLSLAMVALLTGLPSAAQAYVGPGAGLTAIGTLLALVAVVFLAIVGFLWYPIKRLMRRGKGPQEAPKSAAAEDEKPAE